MRIPASRRQSEAIEQLQDFDDEPEYLPSPEKLMPSVARANRIYHVKSESMPMSRSWSAGSQGLPPFSFPNNNSSTSSLGSYHHGSHQNLSSNLPSLDYEAPNNGYASSQNLGQHAGGYTSGTATPMGRQFSNYDPGTATPAAGLYNAAFNTSFSQMALKYRKPFAQRVLAEDEKPYKPWLENKKRRATDRKAYWIFVLTVMLGVIGSALLMYFAYASVPKDKYCLVLEDNFDSPTINKDIWTHEIQTGGFGNGEFEWTTDSANNSFIEDGKLYLVPTLTSDALGEAAVLNGYTINTTLSNTCTASVRSNSSCAVTSNSTTGVILPPIQSARLMTNFSRTIKFGRVEVKARMPTGDWLWPAIWMMPKDSVYGAWPRSGEIDIFEGRGNLPRARSDDASNQMHSTLHFGPNYLFDGYGLATKARVLWRNFFNQNTHTFGLEWTEDHIYTWEHSPVYRNFQLEFKKQDFWKLGRFPTQMANGTLLDNPWKSAQGIYKNIAPFDQEFYLILNVAVGGTNGYFKDNQDDNKPWSNDAANARAQFWAAKDQWLPTWPTDPKQRGMAIESVKMWQKC